MDFHEARTRVQREEPDGKMVLAYRGCWRFQKKVFHGEREETVIIAESGRNEEECWQRAAVALRVL